MTDTAAELTTISALEAHYGAANPTSLTKEIDHINPDYRAFIEVAPFLIIASVGPEGLDCSPRGDPAGFVKVIDPKTLDLPDRRGNNRIDTLRNIVCDPRVSLIFLIPGIGETIRVNGTARILADPSLCETYAEQGKPAKAVVRVTVERVYFQCQKALIRSRLWKPEAQVERTSLPTAGTIIRNLDQSFDGEKYDRDYPERMKQTMY